LTTAAAANLAAAAALGLGAFGAAAAAGLHVGTGLGYRIGIGIGFGAGVGAGRVAAGTRAGAGAGVGRFFVGRFGGFFLLILARRVVALSLLLERGHFDRDAIVVDSDGCGGVHLAFAVVVGLSRALSLSRLTFAQFERAEGASFDGCIHFVFGTLVA